MTQMSNRPDALHTAQALAESSHLPLPTVSKILKLLAHEGLLASQRGTKGGYGLARAPQDISVADILTVLDGPIALTECMGAELGSCDIEALCPTRTNWRKINDAVTLALGRVSLADMRAPSHRFAAAPRVAEPATADQR